MQKVKVLFIALVALASLGATALTATASAENGFLGNANPVNFTISSGGGTFQSLGSSIIVKCTSDSGEGQNTAGLNAKGEPNGEEDTLGWFEVKFKGCTAGGLAATGLSCGLTPTSCASKEIFVEGKYHLCVPVATPLKAYLVLLPNEVHFEVLGILTGVKGAVIGEVTSPSGTMEKITVVLTQSGGMNAIEECEGKRWILESETNGGAFEQSGEETTETITGPATEQIMY